MKKNKNLTLSAAALMLATAGLTTACSSEDVFDGGNSLPADAVKTQFAINIPAGNRVSGRLGQDVVQGQSTPKFRGMQSVVLVPTKGDVAQSGTLSTVQQLGDILSNELLTNSNAKVYYNVELEPGVDHILFYGEGKRATATTTDKDNGVLTAPTAWTTTNDIKFQLKPIAESFGTNPVVTVLNTLVGTQNWSTSIEFGTFYNALQGLNAGSAASVKAALTMLRAGVDDVTPTSETQLKTDLLAAIDKALSDLASETYPVSLGLPDGAARIVWNSGSSQFEQVDANATVGNVILPEAADYVYPAALYYYVNSTLKTSDTPQAENYGQNNWDAIKNLYTTGNSVTETTQSVLMESPVQYAVARLDVNSKFGNNVTDNHKESVDISAGDGMQLMGVLIGGQKNVIYDFTVDATDDNAKTIYDCAFTPTKLTTTGSVLFQTLALQNTQGETVNFALEMVNKTGKAFQGIDGLVPDGGTFYLVGSLTPNAAKAENYVFKQDYTTTANVTINSLAHAYNCIPDLENPSLELGLSVDLKWEEGLKQDVEID